MENNKGKKTNPTVSTAGDKMKNYIKSLENDLQEKRQKLIDSRKFINISLSDFQKILSIHATSILLDKKQNKKFVIDNENKEIINQLYFYITGNQNFKGNLNKGILLVGNIGVGKTLLMRAFMKFVSKLLKSQVYQLHSKKVNSIINADGEIQHKYIKSPLFIDDIGKESVEVKKYGTVTTPIIDLISSRYDANSDTFATSNYSKEDFNNFYGITITDRIMEMFNILRLDGKDSRRK